MPQLLRASITLPCRECFLRWSPLVAYAALLPVGLLLQGQSPAKTPAPDSQIVDGATSPHLIPEDMMYVHLFRLMADRPNGIPIKARAEALAPAQLHPGQVQAVVDAANRFFTDTLAIDQRARTIKDRYWPNPAPAALAELCALDQEREQVVRRLLAGMREVLGKDAGQRLSNHLELNFKPTFKGVPVNPPEAESSNIVHKEHK